MHCNHMAILVLISSAYTFPNDVILMPYIIFAGAKASLNYFCTSFIPSFHICEFISSLLTLVSFIFPSNIFVLLAIFTSLLKNYGKKVQSHADFYSI